MREPLQAFSLSLHPEKTRLLQRGATARSQTFFARGAKEDRKASLQSPQRLNKVLIKESCGRMIGGLWLGKRRRHRP